MGSKPKKSEYQPSAAEKASAAVAMAENKYFKQKYDPLLQKMRDASKTDDSADVLRGRANADTMQTLASGASYDRAATAASGGEEAQAYQAQLGQADKTGLAIKNNMQLGVLGTARGQAADATTGMTAAANQGNSRQLTKAAANQTVRASFPLLMLTVRKFLGSVVDSVTQTLLEVNNVTVSNGTDENG